MRKVFLLSVVVLLSGSVVMAQGRKERKKNKEKASAEAPLVIESAANVTPATTGAAPSAPATTLKAEDIDFAETVHDFGTVMEGPDAKCIFTFTNKGNEPIIIQKAWCVLACGAW